MPKKIKSEIDWEMAFKLISLCHSTNKNVDYYIKWFGYNKYILVKDKLTDTELHCFADGKEIIIIAEGSESFIDWLWNMSVIKKTKNDYGKVHMGFDFAVSRLLKSEVLMKFLESNDSDIYVSGFSKGGAIATVLAPYLFRVKSVYVFGCPRVGDWVYAKNYPIKDRLFMFQNLKDPVSCMPPVWFGYKHIDARVFKFKKGKHGVGEYYKTVSEMLYKNVRRNDIENI